MKKRAFTYLAIIAGLLTACTDEVVQSVFDDGDIKVGDPVMFTTYMPTCKTRATDEENFYAEMNKYDWAANYQLNIDMFEEGKSLSIGTGIYGGTSGSQLLYWPGLTQKYAFYAKAGSDTIAHDQSTEDKFHAQDWVSGFAFEPLWDTEKNRSTDDLYGYNYRTPKEWKTANESRGLSSPEDAKRIPLYLRHSRSLITIILKAAEGVEREKLTYANAVEKQNVETHIYSYGGTKPMKITPLADSTTVDYTADAGDYGTSATGVKTTKYTCVVNPHNYLAGATTDTIARISLSGQHFTFYASNDNQGGDGYNAYVSSSDEVKASHRMNAYNLGAGKHLIITAILGRDSRKILITAYVVDWDETVTTSVVDDYGQNGTPIQINSRKELYDFLKDPKRNKAGNVAIIVPNSLNLETDSAWYYNTDNKTDNDLKLKCTLNLAGATLRTNNQFLKGIEDSGNLVNGTISVGDATVPTAVADYNLGTIERVNVEPKDANGNSSTGKATRAGFVITNSGTISQCDSDLPVYGPSTLADTARVVGGIAAKSFYKGNTMPVIDGCTVNANVNGDAGITGGGIVGEAVGRVTNNTFNYGITLLQNHTDFKNSIHSKYDDSSHQLRAYGNSWPTVASSNGTDVPDTDTNSNTEAQYDAVIDCQQELSALFTDTYNNSDSPKKFRLSSDFSVTKANGWTYGKKTDIINTSGDGNVHFQLDGDDHTIKTDVMLFSNIQNDIKDITIELSADLIAPPNHNATTGEAESTDPIAPLAYAVCNGATISNIQVKGGDYRIQATTVGGIVVWAYRGAKVEDCQCKANIQVWVPGTVAAEARVYTGGIVANAANAIITRCVFHNTSGSLFKNTNTDYTVAGTIETDKSANIFFGGILGGTARKVSVSEDPSVIITDCSSWYSTKDNEYKGAIVGYGRFADVNNQNSFKNGLVTGDAGCQGNWWNAGSRGIGTGFAGMTEEQLLGKRNAVTPTQDNSY